MGNLGDPIEAYQAVLDRLHEQLVKDEPDGQCSALHCVVHRKFSLNIVEMFECDSERYVLFAPIRSPDRARY